MSKSIDIDRAAECVKNIIDTNRCGTCDKLENLHRWSNCGHIVCENCVTREEDCVACVSEAKTPDGITSDESLLQKVNNSLRLLNTFEDSFKTDVYRRHRISEQLKIEKEIFPECIQAPVKYFNKRKSLRSSIANKENRRTSFYVGEEVSSSRGEMEKNKYIQNWLTDTNKVISPRKPFSDINVIEQNFSRINHKNNVTLTKIKKVKNTETTSKLISKANKKRSVLKNKRGFSIDKYLKTAEQENIYQKTASLKSINHKKHNSLFNNITCKVQDESGIVIDDDCIVLDDSQTLSIDKDALAIEAVLEADKKESSDYVSVLENKDYVLETKVNFIKVPYFLKSPLYKTCRDCSGGLTKLNTTQPTKNVSITIVYNMTGHKGNTKQTTSVQTELSEIEKSESPNNFISNIDICDKNAQVKIFDKNIYLDSQGIFSDMINHCETDNIPLNQDISKKSIIIDESDSELEHESLNVTAEVHRSCEAEDYGVLCDMSLADVNDRKRPSARGVTPDSTNSSDKENFDPNKMKRFKCDKKHSKKDKLNY